MVFHMLPVSNAVIPITKAGEWRTLIDVIAVGTYLIGGLPLIWIALQELGFVNKTLDNMNKLKIHAMCIAIFLVIGHIAMVTGMLDPTIFGYQGQPTHGHQAEQTQQTDMPMTPHDGTNRKDPATGLIVPTPTEHQTNAHSSYHCPSRGSFFGRTNSSAGIEWGLSGSLVAPFQLVTTASLLDGLMLRAGFLVALFPL